MTRATRALAIAMCIAAACASAGDPGNSPGDAISLPADASTMHHDGHVAGDAASHLDGQIPDAPVMHDASTPIDAPVGGQFCTDNTTCPDAGTCCYFFQCKAGTGVGSNLCFPN